MIPQPTLDWLRQVSAAYTTQERLFQDVTQTLEMHPGLTPKTDYFTQDDGQTSVLLSLGGTIGVKYKNSLYNIPIRLWIPRIYPNCGPFAFVEPTETMVIKAGQHVDVSGRIYHPYLAYWPQRTQSTIFEFIGILQQLFGEDPPVYAKAQTRVQPTASPVIRQTSNLGHSQSLPRPTNVSPQQQSLTMPRTKPDHQLPSPVQPNINKELSKQHMQRQQLYQLLSQELSVLESELPSKIEQLLSLNQTLQEGQTRMTQYAKMYSDLELHFTDQNKSLEETAKQLQGKLDALQALPDTNLDELKLQGQHQQQLAELESQVHALDDVIYYISTNFGKSNNDPALFMKNVRALAREQFMKKALIQIIES